MFDYLHANVPLRLDFVGLLDLAPDATSAAAAVCLAQVLSFEVLCSLMHLTQTDTVSTSSAAWPLGVQCALPGMMSIVPCAVRRTSDLKMHSSCARLTSVTLIA